MNGKPGNHAEFAADKAASARARSVRLGSPDPPAWATKGAEEPNWRRAALKLAYDVLPLLRELDRLHQRLAAVEVERDYYRDGKAGGDV